MDVESLRRTLHAKTAAGTISVDEREVSVRGGCGCKCGWGWVWVGACTVLTIPHFSAGTCSVDPLSSHLSSHLSSPLPNHAVSPVVTYLCREMISHRHPLSIHSLQLCEMLSHLMR